MSKPNILVIDDDRRYRELLELNLKRRGYRVVPADCGLAGLNELERNDVALVILDLRLPDMDGYEVCTQIRGYSDVPIVMLTARAEETHKVRGLRMGADDYVTKPFAADELMARIEAVLRRCQASVYNAAPRFATGELAIDFSQHLVMVRGKDIHITPQEYKLLYHLAQNAGRVLVQEELLRRVWGNGYEAEPELLHTTVRRVRRKIEDHPSLPRYLLTRRGIGYLLTAPGISA
jgi:DNA-binding response OmpR family regulator